ncbi:P-loop NTPase [Paraburkholderia hayleyella]|uniref:P-loop NTPase n=1 Tax=Paraburkholderia hayleyella TaxID=2152889 RepID=UPI001290A401|nr:P-loop NTPase [Paraburkholderia hayleyella]
MDKYVADQAEGLRRMLAHSRSRVLAVVSATAGAGSTTVVVNLAAALALQGKDVLVLDESVGGLSVSAMLGGLRGVGQANAVLNGEAALEQAAARHALGFAVLAAPHCMTGMRGMTGEPDASAAAMAPRYDALLNGAADIVLIDARLDAHGSLSGLALQAHDVMLVTRVTAAEITETYACLKRLHYVHGLAQFRVLANHVQRASNAQTAFRNLAAVAGRYLGIALGDAGHIMNDTQIARALALSRCLVEAFPSTLAAAALRQLAAILMHWPQRETSLLPHRHHAEIAVSPPRHAGQPLARHA